MSKLYNPIETWAYLGGPWGMADHLVRLLVVPDVVLLLMEKSEPCCNVTGHQVRVLGGKPQQLIINPAGTAHELPRVQFYAVHMHTHAHTYSYV